MRDIELPPVHNKRAPEQWRIISQHVNFAGKAVLDLGCGYGDLLWQAWAADAINCLGVEYNHGINNKINKTKADKKAGVGFGTYFIDIHDFIQSADWRFDIIICFSVLPYLVDPNATLRWIHDHSTQALIECQLAGDGPGFDWLKSPQDMRRWLESVGWKSVRRIGETAVKDRGAKRGIWLCSND